MENLQQIADYFVENELMLVTAESCTAGLIAATVGDLPGCGSWLDCGFVTYSPEAKNRSLGVSFETVRKFGLTSEEVAREMAAGALSHSRANVSVSDTGVAGPSSDDDTPVGTVCFAWGFDQKGAVTVFAETRHFDGDRNAVRQAAADYAIERILFYHEQLGRDMRAPDEKQAAAPGG
jgi:PncC family amidohydrolase